MKINVDQILTLDTGKGIRVFRVKGIYLGSTYQESVVGIETLDKKTATPDGIPANEMFVPLNIIELVICNANRITMPLDVQKRVGGLEQ
jgi:hypothetical protein